MKKFYVILAAIAGMTFTSCTSNEYLGDLDPTGGQVDDGSIKFGLRLPATTRADIAGPAAAAKLGYNFYVTGTKGTEQSYYPTPTEVFDNYLVHYDVNTAGTTKSNTANWEYVGIDQGTPKTPEDYNRVKLSSILGAQTIKYWDYSAAQYDFLAFSTGKKKAVAKTVFTGDASVAVQDDEIGVTAMKYGKYLNVESSIPTAYTFYVPTLDGLENAFITDIKDVAPGDYGKEVTLEFKNLGSKIRVALYETVPGYSVKNVNFYTADAGASPSDLGTGTVTNANLIGADNLSFPTKGTINVRFPHVGNSHDTKQDYNKADAQVTPFSATYNKYKDFGALTNQLLASERNEVKETSPGVYAVEDGNVFLGRNITEATFAGSEDAKFYKTVFPNTSGYALTLRVDYTLVPIDGAKETINVKGAKAVVPSTYTKWLPNYAYTYIFKISDNTNGWTGAVDKPAGLFPITFDAVVTEATDVTGEQTTITTVATPSITTYQKGHNSKTDGSFDVANEYDNDGEDLYVQVMDNNFTPAKLVGDGTNSKLPKLNAVQESATPKYHASLLYNVSDPDATEAKVMDALQNRNAQVADYNADVTGRNNITLYYNSNIDNAVTSIVNGVDNNAITVAAGEAAEINIASLSAGTYAYVYDYTWKSETSDAWTTSTTYNNKENTKVYQPIDVTPGNAVGSKITGTEKNCISTATLATKTAASYFTADAGGVPGAGEAVNSDAYVYFSKTNKTTIPPVNPGDPVTYSYTYSYVSVDGKDRVPAGLLKVPVTELEDASSSTTADAGTFYFEIYYKNDGKYAVKVFKVVD